MIDIRISQVSEFKIDSAAVFLVKNIDDLKKYPFSPSEFEYIKAQNTDKQTSVVINSYYKWSYIYFIEENKEQSQIKEKIRRAAGNFYPEIKKNKHTDLCIVDLCNDAEYIIAFAEGLALSHYQFLKYFSDEENKRNLLKEIYVNSKAITEEQISELNILIEAIYITRDLVNEPVAYLNATKLAEQIQKLGQEANFDVEVLSKSQIEASKMNGLLAVNQGSIDNPSFSILTWKPENATNEKPFVLVGKGVVYDSGGLNIKPGSYMETMKSDMAGGAAVAGTIYALAKAQIPVYVIGLVPATDNRPGGNAYAPDDIITMHSGATVEVKNTDAEGRLLLADALSFAKKYNPELVIDIATLTGSAKIAIGNYGIVAMSNVVDDQFEQLKESGQNVCERIVEFPLWDEYADALKSDIADIKNIGGREAGAITAAKFLQHFVNYPWVHLDIAGCGFLSKSDNYRGLNATGIPVRLLFDFFNNQL